MNLPALLAVVLTATDPGPIPSAQAAEAPVQSAPESIEAPVAEQPAAPRWRLQFGVTTATPAVLDVGVALGVTGEVLRHFGDGPLFASVRGGWAQSDGGNPAWAIAHHQAVAAAGLGVGHRLGPGRIWAQGGLGGVLVYELLSRHQSRRIADAGVPDATRSSWTLGPYAFAEFGAEVDLRGGFSATLSGGPCFFATKVDGATLQRFGLFGSIGVAYAF